MMVILTFDMPTHITAAIIFIDKPNFGRKKTAFMFYLLTAPFIYRFCAHGKLADAFFARIFLFGGVAVTWVATPEMFPTEIRATGHGSSNGFARVGAMSAPFAVSHFGDGVNGFIFLLLIIVILGCTLRTEETLGKELEGGEEEGGKKNTVAYLPPELLEIKVQRKLLKKQEKKMVKQKALAQEKADMVHDKVAKKGAKKDAKTGTKAKKGTKRGDKVAKHLEEGNLRKEFTLL